MFWKIRIIFYCWLTFRISTIKSTKWSWMTRMSQKIRRTRKIKRYICFCLSRDFKCLFFNYFNVNVIFWGLLIRRTQTLKSRRTPTRRSRVMTLKSRIKQVRRSWDRYLTQRIFIEYVSIYREIQRMTYSNYVLSSQCIDRRLWQINGSFLRPRICAGIWTFR